MTKSAQKIHASTQKFTEIQDIVENVVFLNGGNACLVIGVQATNFALLSNEEQLIKISSYASLLNSLSFQIQILIRNKNVDISSYLKLLDGEIQRLSSSPNQQNGQAEKSIEYIRLYRDFVQEMIKINTVLDKKFYIVLTYSSLEKGVGAIQRGGDFQASAKAALHTKAETLMTQLNRLSLKAKILEKEELIKLFYDIYNQDITETYELEEMSKATVVKGG